MSRPRTAATRGRLTGAATLSDLSTKPVDVTRWVWAAGGGDDLDGPHHQCPLARASAAFADAAFARPPDGDFVFSGSLAEAIEQAQAAASGEQVHVMGGADLIRQALAAGLVDELTIIIAPVTLGAYR